MAFWGVEIKPGRPLIHVFDSSRGRLHISQATLGIGSAAQKSLVQCNVGDKSPVLLCSLLPDKTESCPLNLEFEEPCTVMLSIIGPRSVHLTGYFLGNGRHSNLNYDTDSYGEDIVDTDAEESNHYSEEEEYEDSFINDADPEVYPPSPISNGGVVIEKILDSNKSKNGKGRRRLKKKYQLSESDDEVNSQQQRIINHSTGTTVLESEDEDILPISSLYKSKNIAKNTKLEAEEKGDKETGETGKKKIEDDGNHVTESNRKANAVAVAVNGEPERLLPSTEVAGPETGTKPKKKRKERSKKGKILEDYSANHSNGCKEDNSKQDEGKAYNMGQDPILRNQQDQKPVNDNTGADLPRTNSLLSTEVNTENGAKPKKKRKERAKEGNTLEADSSYHSSVLKEEKDQQDGAKADKISQDLSVRNEQDQKPANDKIFDNDAGHFADKKQSEEKKIKKKKKRSKTQENEGDLNMNVPLFSMEEREIEGKNADAKSSKVRTLSNGLVIEELEMGKPDGKIASPGKKVSVHYIGKFRKNGQVFDSNIAGAPLKFRLGVGEVIKGWDVGLDGMRVGDKRRLIIPPSMGYENQGDAENIPPNSWLVFDVELVGVR